MLLRLLLNKNMKEIKTIKRLSSKLLAAEALKRNIRVKHLNPYREDEAILELSYKKHREFIIGQRISLTSLEAYWILEDKELTKSFLKRNNINVINGRVFKETELDKIFSYCDKIKFPVVVKPIFGSHGDMVFVGIENKKTLNIILKKIFSKNKYILIEQEFKGREFRFIADRKKVVSVKLRDPANIIGDGINNIRELVRVKNSDPRRGENYEKALAKIKIDNIIKQNLAEQNIGLDTIPQKGEKIYLRKNSNISTGGDSIDVTNQVHPELKKIATRAVRAIPGLAYGGIDLMTSKSISQKPTKKSYIIIELNSSPGIITHHFPFQGKSINVAKKIIDMLFPETRI